MPGDIDPTSIPPTDALTTGVTQGGPMRRLADKAAARRDEELVLLRAKPEEPPPGGGEWIPPLPMPSVRWVKPVEGRTINDINGVPYPAAGSQVLITDVYAHRRVRDGSLLLIAQPPGLTARETGSDWADLRGSLTQEEPTS